MPVLSAVAILAFVALFGAAAAIIIAVRRSRRRHEQRASSAAHSPSASVNAPPPPMPGAPHLRNFPTRLGKHPAGASGQIEWNPFGSAESHFADLSDPAPGGRRLKPQPRRRTRPNDIGD